MKGIGIDEKMILLVEDNPDAEIEVGTKHEMVKRFISSVISESFTGMVGPPPTTPPKEKEEDSIHKRAKEII